MTSNKNAHPFSPHFVFPGTVEKFLALSTFFLAYSTHCMALSSATSAIAVSTVNATVDNLILTSGFKNRGGGPENTSKYGDLVFIDPIHDHAGEILSCSSSRRIGPH
jgi:hypothetical protein